MKNNITAVVLTKNEEKSIRDCLMSLKFCDEILIVDDFSTDKTTTLAKGKNIKIYKRHLNNDFASQRNFGLSKAKSKWVLFVDADEIVPEKLKKEILVKVKNDSVDGFFLKRELIFINQKITHGEVGKTKLLRLARAGKGVWKRKVHEYWDVSEEVKTLENPLVHKQNKTIREFLFDINSYSKIHSSEVLNENKNFNFLFIIFHPLGKFFVNYIIHLGFLDGPAGFVLSVFMSLHSFLSWSNLWLNQK